MRRASVIHTRDGKSDARADLKKRTQMGREWTRVRFP